MGLTLDKVVPWGRSYEEYVSMFDLSDDELRLRILAAATAPPNSTPDCLHAMGISFLSIQSMSSTPRSFGIASLKRTKL